MKVKQNGWEYFVYVTFVILTLGFFYVVRVVISEGIRNAIKD